MALYRPLQSDIFVEVRRRRLLQSPAADAASGRFLAASANASPWARPGTLRKLALVLELTDDRRDCQNATCGPLVDLSRPAAQCSHHLGTADPAMHLLPAVTNWVASGTRLDLGDLRRAFEAAQLQPLEPRGGEGAMAMDLDLYHERWRATSRCWRWPPTLPSGGHGIPRRWSMPAAWQPGPGRGHWQGATRKGVGAGHRPPTGANGSTRERLRAPFSAACSIPLRSDGSGRRYKR